MREMFVFGSNLAGIHGAGSAKEALDNYGARYGVGVGPFGNSYAIPTKDCNLFTLPLSIIQGYVDQFVLYADMHPEVQFNVVAIGCGLAGFTPAQIGPMFKGCPYNVILPPEFVEYAATHD